MLDIARDPRWGRIAEGPGEDPWLAARMAEAKVRGFQGANLAAADALAAVAKHFCAYGAVTAGRDYASADISERTLREVYMPPFAAAVGAGAAAVMPAFMDLAGIPMTANRELLRNALRGGFGFKGVIVSDYNAIAELVRHGIAADLAQAAAHALKAGVDIDMMADAYRRGLPTALERGLVCMAEIDESVRRVLRLKEQLGLFDDPYRRGTVAESAAALADRRQLARSVGARAIVMLKNERDTLPLARTARSIAVVGPLADAPSEMRGPWWGAAEETGAVSVVAGLRASLPQAGKDCDAFYQQSFLDSPTGYSQIESDLDGIATKAGVRISGFTFKQKELKDRGVTEIQITTNLDADYPAIIQFINGLERSKNFYLLDSLRLASATSGGIRLDLDLHTYFRT